MPMRSIPRACKRRVWESAECCGFSDASLKGLRRWLLSFCVTYSEHHRKPVVHPGGRRCRFQRVRSLNSVQCWIKYEKPSKGKAEAKPVLGLLSVSERPVSRTTTSHCRCRDLHMLRLSLRHLNGLLAFYIISVCIPGGFVREMTPYNASVSIYLYGLLQTL